MLDLFRRSLIGNLIPDMKFSNEVIAKDLSKYFFWFSVEHHFKAFVLRLYMGAMYKVCGLRLGPNFVIRSATDKNYQINWDLPVRWRLRACLYETRSELKLFEISLRGKILFRCKVTSILEYVYMRPEVNSNRFETSNCFEKLFWLHGNFIENNLEISSQDPDVKFFLDNIPSLNTEYF